MFYNYMYLENMVYKKKKKRRFFLKEGEGEGEGGVGYIKILLIYKS